MSIEYNITHDITHTAFGRMVGLAHETIVQVHCYLILFVILAIGLLLPNSSPQWAATMLTAVAQDGQVQASTHVVPSPSVSRQLPPSLSLSPPQRYGRGIPSADAARNLSFERPWCGRDSSILRPQQHSDWIFAADGVAADSWAAQFELLQSSTTVDDRSVHLFNRLSSGCINLVDGLVRGHRNSSPRTKAAPPSATTELQWEEIEGSSAANSTCWSPPRARFHFTRAGSPSYLAVGRDGVLKLASSAECHSAGDGCDFELLPRPAASDDAGKQGMTWDGAEHAGSSSRPPRVGRDVRWFSVRSVATGMLVRLHHSEMPEEASWLGIHPPRGVRLLCSRPMCSQRVRS